MGDARRAVSPTSDTHAHELSSFYDEVASIRGGLGQLNRNVTRISELRSRSINVTDESTVARREATELEELVAGNSGLCDSLKRRIQTLERQTALGSDGEARRQQTGQLKSRFVEEIQNYQAVERQYRQRYGQELERQCKILKPGVTPGEIRAILDDAGGQVLNQTLSDANQSDESHAAYREVQEKHQYLQGIKRTLAELAQLSNDMSIIAGQYEPPTAEEAGPPIQKNTRKSRRNLWFSLSGILAVVLIVIVVVSVVKATK